MIELNKIYQEKNLETMARFGDARANLIMTSPPYAQARKDTYGGIDPDKYVEWFKPIGEAIYKIIADDGSFILNIGDNTIEGETHLYTFELPIMLKRECGFKFIDPFIWHKKTCPPGKFNNRFKGAWEFCYHFSKQIDIKFNPNEVLQPAKQASIARYLIHKETHVLTSKTGSDFTNPSQNVKRRERGNLSGFGTNDKKINMLLEALPSNVLHLAPEGRNVKHSAPFPIELPAFFIKAFTDPGDLVYDPFTGSGTTFETSLKLQRKFVGSEIDAQHVIDANERVSPYRNLLL